MDLRLNEPLSPIELSALEAFLESAACPHEALGLEEAHGFLTAVAIAPTMTMPSEWQQEVFGGECEFATREQAERVTGLSFRFYNQIDDELQRGKLTPLGRGDDTLAAWCRGFLRGVRCDEVWMEDSMAVMLLFPFAALAGEMELEGEEDDKGEIITDPSGHLAAYREMLPKSIQDLHAYWRRRRREEARQGEQRAKPKVGRNEPCPCGSGKKYKKCCGAGG